MSPTIGIAMIVRNEEKYLPDFLKNTAPYVDQLVVVDTGSIDSSVELLKKANVELVEIKWPDDFAKARNKGLEKLKTDLALVLDPDEFISRNDLVRLRELAADPKAEAFRFSIASQVERSSAIRMWRHRPGRLFKDAVRETIDLSDVKPSGIVDPQITIEHHGFEHEAVRHDKGKRNLALLSEVFKTRGAEPDVLFHIATEYYHTGKFERAIEFFEKAIAKKSEIRPMAVRGLAMAFEKLEKQTEMLELLERETKEYPDYIDLWYLCGLVKERMHDFHNAIKDYKNALKIKIYDPKYVSYQEKLIPKTLNGLGWSYLQLGDLKNSEKYFLETLKLEPKNGAAMLYLKDNIWKLEDEKAFVEKLGKSLGKKRPKKA